MKYLYAFLNSMSKFFLVLTIFLILLIGFIIYKMFVIF